MKRVWCFGRIFLFLAATLLGDALLVPVPLSIGTRRLPNRRMPPPRRYDDAEDPLVSVVGLRQSALPVDSTSSSRTNHPQQPRSDEHENNIKKEDRPRISVSDWHRQRRREMLAKYGDQIAPLERETSSQAIGVPLLLLTCGGVWGLAVLCGSLPLWAVIVLAVFPGSILSLWQLQLLHDVVHGSFFAKGRSKVWGIPRKQLQDWTLFWGSLPCVFGYYLYLKDGHLSHHQNAGEHDLATLFSSQQSDFEDGDVLFVAHRMKLEGDYGPKFQLPNGQEFKMSISRSGFHFWREGEAVLNAARFAISFLYERLLLSFNDIVVAALGKNLFFLDKPAEFQKHCAQYARVATCLRACLWFFCGWKSLLFLFLVETLWSLPPHPACAMFVTNHGSKMSEDGGCIPTSSTYAGRWYSILTLGTNYHCEHHDFPTIPFDQLYRLHLIAPEYYSAQKDDLMQIMRETFAHPEFYACMSAHTLAASTAQPTKMTATR